MSFDNCNIGGYDIPPDMMLLINAWAIHRDSKLWDDVIQFKPERFEIGDGNDRVLYSCKQLYYLNCIC